MEELEQFKGGSTLRGPLTLEKIMIFHRVDFGQNKNECCLDVWDIPRV